MNHDYEHSEEFQTVNEILADESAGFLCCPKCHSDNYDWLGGFWVSTGDVYKSIQRFLCLDCWHYWQE